MARVADRAAKRAAKLRAEKLRLEGIKRPLSLERDILKLKEEIKKLKGSSRARRIFSFLIRRPKMLAAVGALGGGYLWYKIRSGDVSDEDVSTVITEIDNAPNEVLDLGQSPEDYAEGSVQPSGTFARGQAEEDVSPIGMLEDQYTPSGNIEGAWFKDRLRPEFPYVYPFDQRVGDVPQPVETPWDQAGRQADVYGAGNRQAELESLQAPQQLAEEVVSGQRPSEQELVLSGHPSTHPQPAPPTPPAPIIIPDMPTTEEAEAGAFDFPDLLERITDEEALVAEAQGIEDGRPGPFEVAAEIGKAAYNVLGHAPQAARQVWNSVTERFESDDGTEELDVSTGIVLDSRGNILSTGEVAEEGDVSTTSTSAKEGLKEQGKREVVQTNVDATVNKYNLSPPIGQALSQIEKNAGILRAASVMMGVKDISSNYRDMSIGQLRLARDIVEDLNGGQGPWKTWWSPDGSQQENLPIKGAAAEPRPGWVDTNPVPRLTGVAKLVQSAKQKIKDGQPWSAYQDAIDYDIAGGYNTPQKHTMTADLMTAWMREFNPELTSSFKWPTRTEYDLWENGKMTDEQFRGFYGFTFQR
tara:strand:- start:360 stop:2111 length:1752 start_codon:yes stop_codon:yes gene_type:complete